ncbi:ankyrin repeat-containing domain protein [Aspergillus bertholletiae]|uniref:Ankyrin repeat-containing domain protein n=1 Tax=Aspergillus bertholletiae TaxID=1226010 RepID=A0A5N7BIJ7_9EURO|nr:ankyrin repeat-containing domain protein [Aspergillus bertholletiae]
MAEVALGVAGSVVGIVSLAGQVCVGFQELYTFLDSIKEAQFDLQCVKDDILLLKNLVMDMSDDCTQSPGHLDTGLLKTSLELCISRINRLVAIIRPLEFTNQRGRTLQAIHAAVKKKRLAEFTKELDSAKITLILVHQNYMRKSTSISFLRVEGRVGAADSTSRGSAVQKSYVDPNSANGENFQPRTIRLRDTARVTYQKDFQLLFGILSTKSEFNARLYQKKASTSNIESESEKRTFKLRFARWFRFGIIELQALKQWGSWIYQLRHYHVIPSDSLLFQFCLDGDLTNVQRLFSKRLASPFDLSPKGQTVLHYSAMSGNTELVYFLLQIGVDANAETVEGENALEYAMSSSPEDKHYDLARLFVDRGQVDPMKQGSRTSVIHSYCGPPEVFRYLVLQDQFLVDPEDRNQLGKTILHYQILHRIYYGDSFHRIQTLFAAGHYRKYSQVTGGDFQSSQHHGYTVLHCAVERWSWAIAEENEHVTQQAERIVRIVLERGEDIHATSDRLFTPLSTIGEMIFRDSSRTKAKVISAWLQLLSNAGYDLDRYCRTEAQLEKRRLETSHHHFGYEFQLVFNESKSRLVCVTKSDPALDNGISTTLNEGKVRNHQLPFISVCMVKNLKPLGTFLLPYISFAPNLSKMVALWILAVCFSQLLL